MPFSTTTSVGVATFCPSPSIRVCNDLGYQDVSIETHSKLTQKEYEGEKPLTIFEDNTGCIELSKNPVHHKRSKHIETKYHYVRDEVLKGTIKLVKTHTDDNIADIYTRPNRFTQIIEAPSNRRCRVEEDRFDQEILAICQFQGISLSRSSAARH